jgi:hypothetical protein
MKLADSALGKAQFMGGGLSAALPLRERLQDMPDTTGAVSVNQLLVLFFIMATLYPTGALPPTPRSLFAWDKG